jgi:hypothetical protein
MEDAQELASRPPLGEIVNLAPSLDVRPFPDLDLV